MSARDLKEQAAWHANYCVHYQRNGGAMEQKCKAGHSYDEIAKVSELGRAGCMLRLPCLKSHADEKERKGQPLCACPSLKWKTEAEATAEAEETIKHLEQIDAVIPLIISLKATRGKSDWQDVIACPVCGKDLHVSCTSYNGHTRGACVTADCISWME